MAHVGFQNHICCRVQLMQESWGSFNRSVQMLQPSLCHSSLGGTLRFPLIP
jgi:hypothetical protein